MSLTQLEEAARLSAGEQHRLPGPRRCGPVPLADGSLLWRVWAPLARTLDLVLVDGSERNERPMSREPAGYFRLVQSNVPEGQRYAFRVDGGPERPDPCSLWQPDGVHRPSAVYDPRRFSWNDAAWRGLDRSDLVFYELHVGTFTPEGTFRAVIPRLPDLRDLGITAIELMPVSQFPGTRNWGYDGVHPYAAQNSYGGPRDLQQLVDACHAAGLAIFLDVVYNHFGPEGNYLRDFAPYFTDHYHTPWGDAVNYDGPYSDGVRDYVVDNVRMWLEEFHFDGLRLDAVHAIYDFGAHHILRTIKEAAEEIAQRTGRKIHIIAESDLNDPRLIERPERGGFGLAGQWADDFHHALHTFFTGEHHGYYRDFGLVEQLAEVFAEPFLYRGTYSANRKRKHGAPLPADVTGERFVVALQNHDQIGNRPRGDRLITLLRSPAEQRLATSMLLLAPYVPLLFMGEEYGEENPFPFFCSFTDPQLIQAVREGRKREFAEFVELGAPPDADAESTFASARLRWFWPSGSRAEQFRNLYRDLLQARRAWLALRDFTKNPTRLMRGTDAPGVLELRRGQGPETLWIYFNLGAKEVPLPREHTQDRKIRFRSESARYGGKDPQDPLTLAPHECVVL